MSTIRRKANKEETMSAIISTAMAHTEQEEDLATLLARWPQFSAPELRRLRFLAYRRATGRLRPSAPLGAAGARVAAEIAASLRAPAAPASQPPVRQEQDATVGVPPLWRTWLEARAAPAPPAPSAGCR